MEEVEVVPYTHRLDIVYLVHTKSYILHLEELGSWRLERSWDLEKERKPSIPANLDQKERGRSLDLETSQTPHRPTPLSPFPLPFTMTTENQLFEIGRRLENLFSLLH